MDGSVIILNNTNGNQAGLVHFEKENICLGSEDTLSQCDGGGGKVVESTLSCAVNGLISCKPSKRNQGDLRLVQRSAFYKVPDFKNGAHGFLEIFINGTWGSVCNRYFGHVDARVACRQLGFPADNVGYSNQLPHNNAYLNTPIHLQEVHCRGGESKLLNCDHGFIGDCQHYRDIILDCAVDQSSNDKPATTTTTTKPGLDLSGSKVAGTGFLQIQRDGQWQAVCSNKLGPNSVAVACRQLGFKFSNAVQLPGLGFSFLTTPKSSPTRTIGFKCLGNETSLHECPVAECYTKHDVAISCIGSDIPGIPNWEKFQIAIAMNDDRQVEQLLSQGVSVHSRFFRCCDEQITSPISISNVPALFCAACYGASKTVSLLIQNGANVEAFDPYLGDTALKMASVKGYQSVVKLLLNAGASVNSINIISKSALFDAAFNNQMAVLKILMEAGADINYIGNDGKTAVDEANERNNLAAMAYFKSIEPGAEKRNDLYLAIMDRNVEKVANLLRQGVYSNSILDHCCHHTGSPALMCAVCVQSYEIVELLLNENAQVDLREHTFHATALLEAARGGNLLLVAKLVTNGANVNALDKDGDSALRLAARFGHTDVVKYLVEQGADTKHTYEGKTARQWAAHYDHRDILRYLTRF